MTTDISKIRESLKNCEEISLPYEFSKNTWIKYITIKGEDEAFYEGGIFTGLGHHKIFLNNKGKKITVPTCIRSDDGEILYKTRLFIVTNNETQCNKDRSELMKVVKAQQKIIEKMTSKIKELETCNNSLQIDIYDSKSLLDQKEDTINELKQKERKYKLIISQMNLN